MTYNQFIERILEDKKFMNEESISYTRKHARRHFSTYKFCLKYLSKGNKILSVGGFHGTVEKMLKENLDLEVTIIDYPESIDIQKEYYEYLGFKYVGIDLSKGLDGIAENYFDMIIYTEVIEHIPLSPYSQVKPFDKFLKKGGKIVITTPNLSSIIHIAKLFMKIPHYDTPEKFFSPIAKENLQVHRREYMPQEITEAFERMGYKCKVSYFIYNEPKSIQYRMMYIIGNAIPRFREGMLIVAIK